MYMQEFHVDLCYENIRIAATSVRRKGLEGLDLVAPYIINSLLYLQPSARLNLRINRFSVPFCNTRTVIRAINQFK
jgi:hypothetical protein